MRLRQITEHRVKKHCIFRKNNSYNEYIDLLIFSIFLSFFACSTSGEIDQKKLGDAMIDIVKPVDNPSNKHLITVNDYGAKSKKTEPATEFPEEMRFIDVKTTTDGEKKLVKIPVAEIRIRPIDSQRNLVDASRATIISIQYLDADGNFLRSDTMQKN